MIGGRNLVDEVNHMNMVVSLCYYVVHVHFFLHDDDVMNAV